MTYIYRVVTCRDRSYIVEDHRTRKQMKDGELFFYPSGEKARVIKEVSHFKEVKDEAVL